MISNTCLPSVPESVPSATRASNSAPWKGVTGLSSMLLPMRLKAPNRSEISQLLAWRATIGLGLAAALGGLAEQKLEPAGGLDLGGEDAGIVGRQAERLLVAAALGVGELGEAGAAFGLRKSSLNSTGSRSGSGK